jgi:hypothetical protein
MPANYVLLEKITVGAAGASSVTFSNIPQTGYTDLVVKISNRNGTTGLSFAGLTIAFNGSSSSFTFKTLGYYGGALQTYDQSAFGSNSVGYAAGSAATANAFSNVEIYIPNYTSSSNKSISADGANGNMSSNTWWHIENGVWASTAAITSLTFNTGDMVAGSSFYLYGVAKLGTTPVISPYATGGDIIETDGTYWYHAFLSSGTFTPQKGISADVLVVAGGGGGGGRGSYGGGGGGAGGLLAFTSQALASGTGYTATVGAGGPGGFGGTNGNNSQFASLTATVGGGGGGYAAAGNSGGSGGGGVGVIATAGGAGTSGQGNAGGNGTGSYGGGGGGSGSAGSSQNGGAGINTYSSWLSVTGLGISGFIAGGGGGGNITGTQGSGGAGSGGTSGTGAVAAVQNTGSGGGGGALSPDGGGANGGSGLVIVRYLV